MKKTSAAKTTKYVEAIGRRKTAVARVRLFPSEKAKEVVINDRKLSQYFPLKRHQETALAPFNVSKSAYKTSIKISGGGLNAQAEAVRLGISRALVTIESTLRPQLKSFGFLRRDPRMVERKHPGLRKARRAQQWRKR